MSVYRFKVYFEDDESVYREIEIKATQNFEDFHKAIQKAINFDDSHTASFYVSNDTWRKGKEIRLVRNKQNHAAAGECMHEVKIAKYVEDPHQKFIYEFDPDGGNWILMAELSKILPDSPITYPRVSKTVGTAPVQYKVTTPVEVAEDVEEGEHVEEEDNYVKNMPQHYEEDENEEVEHEIKAHSKQSSNGEAGEGEEVAEEGASEEGSSEGLEEGGGEFEEEL